MESNRKNSRVLFVGGDGDRDFREAADWLREHAQVVFARNTVADWDAVLAREHAALSFNWIVVAESRPGEFSAADIERLHRRWPLARVIGLMGSWCEGEVRSGRPWPGVIRVYWHQWLAQASRELAPDFPQSNGGEWKKAWQLPRTTTAAERALRLADSSWPSQPGLVALACRSRATFLSLAEVCLHAGRSAVWWRPHDPPQVQGVSAAIWDGVDCGPAEAGKLTSLAEHFAPAPLLALLDFVRSQDVSAARQAGAAAVLAKPFLIDDLVWHLDRLTRPRLKLAAEPAVSPAA